MRILFLDNGSVITQELNGNIDNVISRLNG